MFARKTQVSSLHIEIAANQLHLITVAVKAFSPRTRWWLLAATLLLFVALSSGIGVRNGFAYDDIYVIQRNSAVMPTKQAAIRKMPATTNRPAAMA